MDACSDIEEHDVSLLGCKPTKQKKFNFSRRRGLEKIEEEEVPCDFILERQRNIAMHKELINQLGLDKTKKQLENFLHRGKKKRTESASEPAVQRDKSKRLCGKNNLHGAGGLSAAQHLALSLSIQDVLFDPGSKTNAPQFVSNMHNKSLYEKSRLQALGCVTAVHYHSLVSKFNLEAKRSVLPGEISSMVFLASELAVLLACGDTAGRVMLWNYSACTEDEKVLVMAPHRGQVSCLSGSDFESDVLFSGSLDGTVRRCSLTGQSFSLVYGTPNSLPIHWLSERSPHSIIAAAAGGKVVRIDTRTGPNQQKSFSCHTSGVCSVSVNRNTFVHLATCSDDRQISMWDLRMMSSRRGNSGLLWTFHTERPPTSTFFSPSGYHLLTALDSGHLCIYEAFKEQIPLCIWEHKPIFNRFYPSKAMWHPSREDSFMTCGTDEGVDVYKCDDTFLPLYTPRRKIHLDTDFCNIAAFHPTFPIIAAAHKTEAHLFM